MNFKTSLDRYLTTEPQDDFTPYAEAVYEKVKDNIFTEFEAKKFDNSFLEGELLNILYFNAVKPEIAAQFLEAWFLSACAKSVPFTKCPKAELFIRIKSQNFR